MASDPPGQLRGLVRQVLNVLLSGASDGRAGAKTVTVHVLNATNRQGLAAGARSKLAKAGFVVADIGNDDVPIAGVAEIRYGPAGRAAAKLVAYYFPGATLIGSARTDSQVEIALGAKFTTVSATATVKQAMARDHVTQAEVGPPGTVTYPVPIAGADEC